jgi:hypothetical protein
MPSDYVNNRDKILLDTVTFVWQFNTTKSNSETFADFFVAWMYGGWKPATDPNGNKTIAGKASDWMYSSMPGWLR